MGRLLAIDPGRKRIGMAISDEFGWGARPLEVWRCQGDDADWARVGAVVKEWGVTRVVVGLPCRLDGTEGPAAARVRAWGAGLEASLAGCPVTYWDEALTSWAAQTGRRSGGSGKKRGGKAPLDAEAAAVLLQDYLDAQAKDDGAPGG